MRIPKIKHIAHVVLYVREPEASARWYGEVLGMKVSARVPEGIYKGGIFMTFGEYDHDIALFPAKDDAPRGKEFEHIGLQVDCENDVDSLRRLYGWLIQNKVRIHEVLDHGVSTGIYFYDPDGHQLEVFCQRVPFAGGAAIEEIGRNQGKALNIPFQPLDD